MTKTLTSEGAEKQAIYGWDGAAWHKLPMVWGYSDRYTQQVADADADEGTNILSGTTVGAGEVWVVTSISASDDTTQPTLINIYLYDGATYISLFGKAAPAAEEQVSGQGHWVLKEGDSIRAIFYGVTADDNIYLNIAGYKMKIAE